MQRPNVPSLAAHEFLFNDILLAYVLFAETPPLPAYAPVRKIATIIYSPSLRTVAETWRRVWGYRKNFRGPRWGFFRKKFSFSLQKFLMTSFFPIFRIFTLLDVVHDPSLTRKTPVLLFSYFRAHPTTLLLKILGGGTNAWAAPQSP